MLMIDIETGLVVDLFVFFLACSAV